MDPAPPSPNILLTNACLRSCAYCFAETARPSSRRAKWMTREGFATVLGWLETSGVTEIRLLGGEPLLHPQLGDLLKMMEAGAFARTTVFTSLLAPEQNVERLVSLAARMDVKMVANLGEPATYDGADRQVVLQNLATAVDSGISVTIGHNIYLVDQDLDWLVPLCRLYGIENVRLAVASPSGLGTNVVVADAERSAAGRLVTSTVRELDRNRIAASLDCLVTPCMFSGAAWAYLSRTLHRDSRSLAECYPPLDIGADLSITRCFATSTLEIAHVEDFETTGDAWKHFVERIDAFRREATSPECRACAHFKLRHCSGGCIGFHSSALTLARSNADRAGPSIIGARDALHAREPERAISEFERAFAVSTHDAAAVCDYIATLVRIGRHAEASAVAIQHAETVGRAPRGLAAFVSGLLAEAGGDDEIARGHYRLSLRHADEHYRDRVRRRLEEVSMRLPNRGSITLT